MNNRRVLLKSYVWGHIVSNRLASLLNSIKGRFKNLTLIGNSVQGENPAPEHPQEIKSAGRKSKNLLDINYFKDKSNLQTIQCEGFSLLGIICNVKPNTEYTLSANLNGAKYNLNIANKATRFSLTSSFKRTLMSNDDGTLYIGFYGVTADNVNMDDFMQQYKNIQLEEGAVATDYEPYGYFFDMKVTGKNLFDMADIQNENGKIDSDFGKAKSIKPFKVIKDRKYLLISKGTMIADVRYSSIYFGEDDLTYGQDSNRKLTTGTGYSCFIGTEARKILVAKETCTITKTMMHGTKKAEDAYEVEELGLFEIINDNPNTYYEPYTEQTVQIALDEPLRGVGEYKDTITKDGVVRKIYEQTLKKERISMNEYNWDTKYFRLYVNPDKKIDSSTTITRLFSNMFKGVAIYKGNPTIYWLISEEEIRSMGITEADSREVAYEKIKDFVTNNDIVVQYPIVETTLEPLSESVQAQLSAFHSENGTTHVFVDSGEVEAGISVTYKQKK